MELEEVLATEPEVLTFETFETWNNSESAQKVTVEKCDDLLQRDGFVVGHPTVSRKPTDDSKKETSLRISFRKAALLRRKQTVKRSVDYVPWEARFIRSMREGRAAPSLPPAPLPHGPERERLHVVKPSSLKPPIVVPRKKEKSKQLSMKHVGVQSVVAKEQIETQQSIGVQTDVENEPEVIAMQLSSTLSSPRFDATVTQRDASREQPRRASELDVIKELVRQRWASHLKELLELKLELQSVVEELACASQMTARKKGIKASIRDDGKQKRAFLAGVSTAQSRNKFAWVSHETRQRATWEYATAHKTHSSKEAWEGSEFKVLLLGELSSRLRLLLALKAWKAVIETNQLRYRLCNARLGRAECNLKRKCFDALSSFHQGRQWLRERCKQHAGKRTRKKMAHLFASWVASTKEEWVARGKRLSAESFRRRKLLWKGFLGWRATCFVLERYEALCTIRAAHWARKCSLFRAFLAWRSMTVIHKTLRIRLVLYANLSPMRFSHLLQGRVLDRIHVPVSLTRRNLRGTLFDWRQGFRERLLCSTLDVMESSIEGVVRLANFGLRISFGTVSFDKNGRMWECFGDRVNHIRSRQMHSCFLKVGRLGGQYLRKLGQEEEVCSMSNLEAQISQALFYSLSQLNGPPFSRWSLRGHIRAVRELLAGNLLVYPIRQLQDNKNTAFHQEWDSEDDSILEDEKQMAQGKRPRLETVKVQVNDDALIRRVKDPGWFKSWKSKLVTNATTRRTKVIVFESWKALVQEQCIERMAVEFARGNLLRRTWRTWEISAAQAGIRREMADDLGYEKMLRRCFDQWREYCSLWKRLAWQGPRSCWSRWKCWAKAQQSKRTRRLEIVRNKTLARCMGQWKAVHMRRRLLSKVFSLREKCWQEKFAFLSMDKYSREFHLLAKVFSAWRERAREHSKATHDLENLEVAHFFWRDRAARRFLCRLKCNLRRNKSRFRFGEPVWT